ncbi:MAG TPA: glycosyltransferase family 39 protein [Pirellulales bacterium]|nr:glycosyltransferase family 39 protein [Pirellulales bacterium]
MDGRRRWYLEWEAWALAALVLAIYLSRIESLSLTGEETRRGLIALEMVELDDLVVPRQQGRPALFRPPLQNWIISFVAWLHGSYDEFAVRLPSVIATLFTVLGVYAYCREFMSRIGALGGALSMATMAHVLQYGWLGETEALYVLIVGGSMLAWRRLDERSSPYAAWCIGYALAGLGMLTKGPQAPMLFAGSVGLFLIWQRRARELLARPHLAGIALFVVIYAAWEIPFYLRVGSQAAWGMFANDVAARFEGNGVVRLLRHLALFPLEVFACLLPWGITLLAFVRRDIRRSLGATAIEARFFLCCVAIGFISCWLVPGAKNRYFAPLYPCVAVLVGLAIDRLDALGFQATTGWRVMVRMLAVAVLVTGAWFVGVTLIGYGPQLGTQPFAFAIAYGLISLTLAMVFGRSIRMPRPLAWPVMMLCVAVFLGLTYNGAVVNTFIAARRAMDRDVLAARSRLPAGAKLVSIGEVAHNFAFYYGEVIPRYDDQAAALGDSQWTYFCAGNEFSMPACDFPHSEIARVSCDPHCSITPRAYVIIGRREAVGVASRPDDHLPPR